MRYLILLFSCLPSLAYAASFDCAKASHPLEKIICSDNALSTLDEKVAGAYKMAQERLFDDDALRAMQRNWQQMLRTRCAEFCTTEEVRSEYAAQLESLDNLKEEIYVANYKSMDVAELTLYHIDSTAIDIRITRSHVDTPDKHYCALPRSDDEAGAVAKRKVGSDTATWSNGEGCTLTLEREGNAMRIRGSEACGKTYCAGTGFTLDDRYISENYWVPGNQ